MLNTSFFNIVCVLQGTAASGRVSPPWDFESWVGYHPAGGNVATVPDNCYWLWPQPEAARRRREVGFHTGTEEMHHKGLEWEVSCDIGAERERVVWESSAVSLWWFHIKGADRAKRITAETSHLIKKDSFGWWQRFSAQNFFFEFYSYTGLDTLQQDRPGVDSNFTGHWWHTMIYKHIKNKNSGSVEQ